MAPVLNGYGQASPDDPAGYLTNPAITTIDDRLTDVARREQHTCALASDRTVWCW